MPAAAQARADMAMAPMAACYRIKRLAMPMPQGVDPFHQSTAAQQRQPRTGASPRQKRTALGSQRGPRVAPSDILHGIAACESWAWTRLFPRRMCRLPVCGGKLGYREAPKAAAACRGPPEGTASSAAHCGVAFRLRSRATLHPGRLALHRAAGFRGGEMDDGTPWPEPALLGFSNRCEVHS
jgi:hypothetical protein